MTDKKRIAYLDIARGIGMILVVMGHVEYVNSTLRQFISAFHMPLFFLISGILIWERQEQKRSLRELIKHKLRSIMLPYAVFSLLSFVIEGSRIAIKGLAEWPVVFRQLYQSLCLQGVSTLWFLPALFMSELIFIAIHKKTKNGWTIVIVSAITATVVYLNTLEKTVYSLHADSLAWGLLHDVLSMVLRNLFCLVFVGAGYYLRKYVFPSLDKVWKVFAALIAFVILTCLVVPMNWGVDLRYMNLGRPILYLAGAFGGSMMILSFSRLLEAIPIKRVVAPLKFYGRNSLIIMVTHMDFRVLYCSIRLADMVQQVLSCPGAYCICILVLVFLIEIPIIFFINRYIPMILGKEHKIS